MGVGVYYNDNDRDVVAWLRALVAAGELPDGEVDDRSITAVCAADLRGFRQHHFFAGIGGWPLALRLASWPDDRAVWTGSCPCQPFSSVGESWRRRHRAAGRAAGAGDARDLWPVFRDLIAECRPDVVFGEQVASVDGLRWLDGVLTDLEAARYAAGAFDLCAAGVGAPHIRQRLYWVGHAVGARLEGHTGDGDAGGPETPRRPDAAAGGDGALAPGVDAVSVLRGLSLRPARDARRGLRLSADRRVGPRSVWAEFDALACADGWRRVRSGSFPMAHGLSGRVERLRGYGNAVVPPVAAALIRAYLETVDGEA